MINVAIANYYQLGDIVENFGAPICMNGNEEQIWEYNSQGTNQVTLLSFFATW